DGFHNRALGVNRITAVFGVILFDEVFGFVTITRLFRFCRVTHQIQISLCCHFISSSTFLCLKKFSEECSNSCATRRSSCRRKVFRAAPEVHLMVLPTVLPTLLVREVRRFWH